MHTARNPPLRRELSAVNDSKAERLELSYASLTRAHPTARGHGSDPERKSGQNQDTRAAAAAVGESKAIEKAKRELRAKRRMMHTVPQKKIRAV